MGRRTAKIRNGETTVYHWQEDTLAIESTNGQNTHYLFEPGTFEPLAQFQTASPIGIEREDKPAEPYSYDPETDPLLKIPPEPQGQSEAQPDLVYYQTPGINMGLYRAFEMRIAKDIRDHGSGKVDILFNYPNANSKMPNAILYTYEVGGKRYTQPFENPNPCTNKGKL